MALTKRSSRWEKLCISYSCLFSFSLLWRRYICFTSLYAFYLNAVYLWKQRWRGGNFTLPPFNYIFKTKDICSWITKIIEASSSEWVFRRTEMRMTQSTPCFDERFAAFQRLFAKTPFQQWFFASTASRKCRTGVSLTFFVIHQQRDPSLKSILPSFVPLRQSHCDTL